VQHTHQDTAALAHPDQTDTADQKVLTLLDQRTADQKQLAGIYEQWSALVNLQSHSLAHTLLFNALIVIIVFIAMLLLDGWLQRPAQHPKLDRRQVETLRSIARVGLRVAAVVAVLLIVVGNTDSIRHHDRHRRRRLTVASKDFIVAFFGWLIVDGPQWHSPRRLVESTASAAKSRNSHVPHRVDETGN